MKRIFIYSYNLELGGVERSLIGLLEALSPSDYKVDLFLAKHEGELMDQIPSYVRLLPEERRYQAFGIPLSEAVRRGFIYESAARVFAKAANNTLRFIKRDGGIALESFIYHKSIIKKMPPQKGEYDLAISFAMPYFYVLTKVNAARKLGFVHTDYGVVHIDAPFIRKMFGDIDRIAAVSESVRLALIKNIPVDPSKTTVFENILSPSTVRVLSKEPQSDMPDDGSVRLLSVGRFSKQKNFDNVPEICARIAKAGINVKWYLIGFGSDEEIIRSRTAEANIGGRVVILGKKANPYPYMAACDIYVQPSRYEGKAVTVREAQILGRPVVITDFPTSSSQLEDGADGIIVPMDNAGCADAIIALIKDGKKRAELSACAASRDYSNSGAVKTLEM